MLHTLPTTWGPIDVKQVTCSINTRSSLSSKYSTCRADLNPMSQKIARWWGRAFYSSLTPIASKPGSSPPEWPGLDNITSQPWSEATCPCTSSVSAYLRFVTIFLLEKTRQSTRSKGTGASCGRPWWLVTLSRLVRSEGDKSGFEAIRGHGREH